MNMLDPEKADRALRESEEKLRNILASSPNAIILTDLKGTIIECNQATMDIYGFSSKEEIIGKNAFDFITLKDHKGALENMQKTLKQGLVKNVEYTCLAKDGSEFPVELSVSVIRDLGGRPTSFMAITRDITKRKQAEEKIKAKTQFLESLIEQSPLPTFVIDSEGIIVMVNKAFLKAYIVPTKEMVLGKNALTEPANVRQGVVKYIKEALSGKIVETPEIEFISPHRNRKTITKSRLFPIFDATNTLTNVVIMHEDITERKKAQDELIKETTFLKAIVDCVPGAVFVLDENMKQILWTRRNKEVAGWTPEELQRMKPLDFFAEEDRPRIANKIQEAFSKGTANTEANVLTKGGARAHYYLSVAAPLMGDRRYIVAIGLDITERKKMEEKERQYFNDLAFLSRTAMELVEFTSKKDIYCYVGEQIRQLFPESIVIINSFNEVTDLFRVRAVLGVGKSTTRFLKILRREPVGMTFPINDQARKGLSKGELAKVPGGLYELAVNQIPQSVCNVLEKLLGIGDVYAISFIWKGELCGSAAILMRKGREPKNPKLIETFVRQSSVTLQRLQTEEAVHESEEKYRELAESITDVFFVMDKDLRYTYWNKASEKLTGTRAKNAIGKTIFDIFPDGEDTRRAVSVYKEVLKTQQSRSFVNEYQLAGKTYFFEINAYPSKNGNCSISYGR